MNNIVPQTRGAARLVKNEKLDSSIHPLLPPPHQGDPIISQYSMSRGGLMTKQQREEKASDAVLQISRQSLDLASLRPDRLLTLIAGMICK